MSRHNLAREPSYSLDIPRTYSPHHPFVVDEETIIPIPTPSKRAVTPHSTIITPPQTPPPPIDSTKSTQKHKPSSVAAEFGLTPLPEDEFISYTIYNASLTNLRVCPIDLTSTSLTYYYIESRSFIPNKPGVTMHAGCTKDDPIIGIAHLDYFSTSNLLGIGDPEGDPTGVIWEKLHKESFWTHMRYSFSWEGKKYEWVRTKNVYFVYDQGDLVLVEEGKGEVLAEYKGKGVIGQVGVLGQVKKQRGTLRVIKGREEGWEKIVVLSWASIVELQRRRTRERRVSAIFGRIV